MKVCVLEKDKDSLWNDYIKNNQSSSIYHLIHWREVFENSFGYKSFYLTAIDSSNSICGVLPIFLVNGLKRRLVSVPFRDRGGPLGDTEDVIIMLLEECIKLANRLKCQYVEIKTLTTLDEEVKANVPYHEIFHWVNSYVELKYNVDEFWKQIGDKTRNMIRQAERAGLEFIDCSESKNSIKMFYDIYVRAMKNIGVPPYSIKYFNNIHKYFIANNDAKLFIIRRNSNLLAGVIAFIHKDSVHYGFAPVLTEARKYRCHDFMVWNLIRWAIENQYKIFDFGADSPLQEGLLFFKKKWKSIQEKIPFYYYTGTNDKIEQMDSSLEKYELFKSIYKKLPMPIFKISGRIVTKYFG
jgi:serine/alanine adding enzyme